MLGIVDCLPSHTHSLTEGYNKMALNRIIRNVDGREAWLVSKGGNQITLEIGTRYTFKQTFTIAQARAEGWII